MARREAKYDAPDAYILSMTLAVFSIGISSGFVQAVEQIFGALIVTHLAIAALEARILLGWFLKGRNGLHKRRFAAGFAGQFTWMLDIAVFSCIARPLERLYFP